MADEHEGTLNLPASIVVASLIGLAIFLIALFGPKDVSTALSNAGQALGAVAGAAAIVAVVYTSHQLELQRLAINEQQRAARVDYELRQLDEIRRAYAQILADTDDLSTSIGVLLAKYVISKHQGTPADSEDISNRIRRIEKHLWSVRLLDKDQERLKGIEFVVNKARATCKATIALIQRGTGESDPLFTSLDDIDKAIDEESRNLSEQLSR